MINNKKMFESLTAFYILIGIIVVLFAVSFFCGIEKKGLGREIESQGRGIEEISEGNDEEWIPGPGDEGYYGTNDNIIYDGTLGYSYEVIAEDGIINVYSISPEGKRVLFYETEIPYELLSESDKIMLRKGMKLNSMDELNDILQDFDS